MNPPEPLEPKLSIQLPSLDEVRYKEMVRKLNTSSNDAPSLKPAEGAAGQMHPQIICNFSPQIPITVQTGNGTQGVWQGRLTKLYEQGKTGSPAEEYQGGKRDSGIHDAEADDANVKEAKETLAKNRARGTGREKLVAAENSKSVAVDSAQDHEDDQNKSPGQHDTQPTERDANDVKKELAGHNNNECVENDHTDRGDTGAVVQKKLARSVKGSHSVGYPWFPRKTCCFLLFGLCSCLVALIAIFQWYPVVIALWGWQSVPPQASFADLLPPYPPLSSRDIDGLVFRAEQGQNEFSRLGHLLSTMQANYKTYEILPDPAVGEAHLDLVAQLGAKHISAINEMISLNIRDATVRVLTEISQIPPTAENSQGTTAKFNDYLDGLITELPHLVANVTQHFESAYATIPPVLEDFKTLFVSVHARLTNEASAWQADQDAFDTKWYWLRSPRMQEQLVERRHQTERKIASLQGMIDQWAVLHCIYLADSLAIQQYKREIEAVLRRAVTLREENTSTSSPPPGGAAANKKLLEMRIRDLYNVDIAPLMLRDVQAEGLSQKVLETAYGIDCARLQCLRSIPDRRQGRGQRGSAGPEADGEQTDDAGGTGAESGEGDEHVIEVG